MRTRVMPLLALLSLGATPAIAARVHQQGNTEQRLRELEQRLREREEELRDIRREMEDLGGATRYRVRSEPRVTVGPMGLMNIMSRPKFGFIMTDSGRTDGAIVTGVGPGTPAARAGLKAGDLITMFNGVRLQGQESPADELLRQARDLETGDSIQVEVRRGNERKVITMVVEALDPDAFAFAYDDSTFAFGLPRKVPGGFPEVIDLGRLSGRWLEMELVSLDKDLGEYFGTAEGVLVVRAPRDTALNLMSGDVILSIDGRKASNPAQAMRILRSYDAGETFEIQVMRQKRRHTVTARIPARDRGFFYQQDY